MRTLFEWLAIAAIVAAIGWLVTAFHRSDGEIEDIDGPTWAIFGDDR